MDINKDVVSLLLFCSDVALTEQYIDFIKVLYVQIITYKYSYNYIYLCQRQQ